MDSETLLNADSTPQPPLSPPTTGRGRRSFSSLSPEPSPWVSWLFSSINEAMDWLRLAHMPREPPPSLHPKIWRVQGQRRRCYRRRRCQRPLCHERMGSCWGSQGQGEFPTTLTGSLYLIRYQILSLSDTDAQWNKKLGLILDLTDKGLGIRTSRYALIIDDLVIKYFGVSSLFITHHSLSDWSFSSLSQVRVSPLPVLMPSLQLCKRLLSLLRHTNRNYVVDYSKSSYMRFCCPDWSLRCLHPRCDTKSESYCSSRLLQSSSIANLFLRMKLSLIHTVLTQLISSSCNKFKEMSMLK